ncbi:MAG: hypothetical protein Aurels2KO_50980 [Aureliella sp.]
MLPTSHSRVLKNVGCLNSDLDPLVLSDHSVLFFKYWELANPKTLLGAFGAYSNLGNPHLSKRGSAEVSTSEVGRKFYCFGTGEIAPEATMMTAAIATA